MLFIDFVATFLLLPFIASVAVKALGWLGSVSRHLQVGCFAVGPIGPRHGLSDIQIRWHDHMIIRIRFLALALKRRQAA